MKRICITILGSLLIAVIGSYEINASVISNFDGSADIASVMTDMRSPRISTDTGEPLSDSTISINSLDQAYSLYWQKRFSPYLTFRALMLYNRLGVDVNADNSLREDWQPGGELIFSHELFTLTNAYRLRITESDAVLTNLEREELSFNAKSTLPMRYPRMQMRYDNESVVNPDNRSIRDKRLQRFSFNSSYEYDIHDFNYSMTYRHNESHNTSLTLEEIDHSLRWRQHYWDKNRRYRLASSYLFNYSGQNEVRGDTTGSLIRISFLSTLYENDQSPQQGMLPELSGLSDGNTNVATEPPINIGAASLHQNLGVHIGVGRDLSGLHLYTNRPSGGNVLWQLYVSDNNLNWQPYQEPITGEYDLLENRYEFRFPTVTSEYIKIVNISANPADSVFVTELVPLITTTVSSKSDDSQTLHMIDLSGKYEHNDKYESRSELSYRNESGGIGGSRRQDFFISYGGRYQINERMSHNFDIQLTAQDLGSKEINTYNRNMYYNFLYNPFELLEFSASLQNLRNSIGGELNSELSGIFTRLNGSMLPTLHFSSELSFSRNNQIKSNFAYHTIGGRLNINGNLTRRIDFAVSSLYRYSKKVDHDESSSRSQFSANLSYRATRDIFMRGDISVTNDEDTHIQQDYMLSWNLSHRLSVNSQAGFTNWGGGEFTQRYGINGNLTIKSRGKIYISFNVSDLYEIGGAYSESVFIGYKTGF